MGTLDTAFYANFGDGATTGWWAVTQWANITASVGQVIRQKTAPSQNNERCFVCIVGGATGSTEPTWVVTRGAKNTSSAATYQECTGIAALNGDASNTVNWSTYHSVNGTTGTLGQVIKDGAGTHIFIMSTAGTIGSVEPTWNTSVLGNTTADNGATWTYIGTASGNTTSFTAWGAPWARLAMVINSGWSNSSTSFIFYGSASAETFSGACSLPFASSPANTISVLAINTGGNVPPQSSDVTTGATLTGNASMNVNGSVFTEGVSYGVSGNGTVINLSNALGSGTSLQTYKNGNFLLSGTSTTIVTGSGVAAQMNLNNYLFAGTSTGVQWGPASGEFNWRNSSPNAMATFGANPVITANASGRLVFEGVDFGSLSAAFGSANQAGATTFKDCKVSSSTWPPTASTANFSTSLVDSIRSDSGANSWIQRRQRFGMSHISDSSVFRAGGATDGATRLSWKFLSPSTSAGSSLMPWYTQPMRIWNNNVGNVTVSIYGTWAGASAPTNAQWWISITYYNSSSDADSTVVSTGVDFPSAQATNISQVLSGFNAATSWPVDSVSSWTGGSTTNFVMSKTLAVRQVGYLFVTVAYGGGVGSNMWIDPAIVLS